MVALDTPKFHLCLDKQLRKNQEPKLQLPWQLDPLSQDADVNSRCNNFWTSSNGSFR
jgi:hypothetical protein